MGRLDGKVAVITGGGTGIGRATAIALAREGADVAVNYSRSEEEAFETVEEIGELGRRSITVQADVSQLGQVEDMFDRVRRELGLVDILVNSAGRTYFVTYDRLEDVSEEIWETIFAVNVKGTFFCCRAAAAQMKQKGSGAIVNIASISGMTGQGSSVPYACSKGALITLTKALSRAFAPEIRVNSISPGVVETRWVDGWEDFVRRSIETTPLGRNATADDVAEIALALVASAGFVTGTNIVVDGGRTI
jgi:3-oxoacyl-[acyl-carrier protein] reductase